MFHLGFLLRSLVSSRSCSSLSLEFYFFFLAALLLLLVLLLLLSFWDFGFNVGESKCKNGDFVYPQELNLGFLFLFFWLGLGVILLYISFLSFSLDFCRLKTLKPADGEYC